LNVNGAVSPDVSRQVAVASLATGRVVEIHARLGDQVQKGQLLFRVRSNDIAVAYSDYQKAVKNQEQAIRNEQLTKIQLDRAKLLFAGGAVAKSAVEIADLNETASITAIENAKVDVATTAEKLKLLGSDPEHPTGIVDVVAPVSGVITDQQITESSGVQALTPPNPFTISDLSNVWVVCDVYENDLAFVRIGDYADVKLNAYPDKVFKGRVSNIGSILDPNLRTAKVRLEMTNPGGNNGLMKIGMFVSATFHGQSQKVDVTVPATAVLHLHDRDWVYVPADNGSFRRLEVSAGAMLPGNQQEIASGLQPGQQVVSNALVLQNTSEQ
jgi:cobalt-zinc-cadmium efflux system membrane fusion protein